MTNTNTRNIHRSTEAKLEEELAVNYMDLFDTEKRIRELATQPGGEESQEMIDLKANLMGFHMQLDIIQTGIRHALEKTVKKTR